MTDIINRLKGGVKVRDLGYLVPGIERAVVQSIQIRPQRDGGVTEHEMKRRAEWCVNTSLDLLHEHRWSVERVVDSLPDALVQWLDEGKWEPPKHGAWFGQEV